MTILLPPPIFAAPAPTRPLQQPVDIDHNLDLELYTAIPIWLKMASQSHSSTDDGFFGFASTSTSQSPPEVRNCFCGNVIKDGEGIYCSAGMSLCDHLSLAHVMKLPLGDLTT
jgi:hypothetical protein